MPDADLGVRRAVDDQLEDLDFAIRRTTSSVSGPAQGCRGVRSSARGKGSNSPEDLRDVG